MNHGRRLLCDVVESAPMALQLRCKKCGQQTTGSYTDKCAKCGAVDWKSDDSPSKIEKPVDGSGSFKSMFLVLLTLFGLVLFAFIQSGWDFGELEDTGWIHHDKMTAVFMKDWVNGEYKQCTSYDESKNEPILVCGESKDADGKLFKVRFYGRTIGPAVEFRWRCKRTNASEPMFVCENPTPITK